VASQLAPEFAGKLRFGKVEIVWDGAALIERGLRRLSLW